MAEAEQEPEKLKDLSLAQEMMTVYLYGLYTLKGGRLTPADAIQYVLTFASFADRVNTFGKGLMKTLTGSKHS